VNAAIFKDWKTSVMGVAVLAVTAAFLMGRVDVHQYIVLVGTLAGSGLVLAKDGGK
jgi:hypothetical protein